MVLSSLFSPIQTVASPLLELVIDDRVVQYNGDRQGKNISKSFSMKRI